VLHSHKEKNGEGVEGKTKKAGKKRRQVGKDEEGRVEKQAVNKGDEA
jgi:hypothetical protein